MPEAELTEPLDPAAEKGASRRGSPRWRRRSGPMSTRSFRRRSVNAQDFETLLQTVHRRALATASQAVKVIGAQRS